MKYVGSKRRLAPVFLPFFEKLVSGKLHYVEPFCGGCNMLERITGINRCASDNNPYLIALLKHIQSNFNKPSEDYLPVGITEKKYSHVKANKEAYEPWYVGYVGFNSYGGKFFGGYRRDRFGKRDYWLEHRRHLSRQAKLLVGVEFHCCDYRDLEFPYKDSLVYCDPPYRGVLGYGSSFDTDSFFNWCRFLKRKGATVLVSEYQAPFSLLWEGCINNTLVSDTGAKQGTERLYLV